jgi:putative Holliday junction resolvase
MARMARILGLDIGERRIGIAISDPEGRFAVPLRVLTRRGDTADEQELRDLTQAEGVELLVVGLPLSMDGSVGAQARIVQALAGRIGEATGLRIEFWDERLTSVQAERAPAGGRKRGGRRPPPADDRAAAIILQGYLDRQRSKAERGPAS